MSIMKVDGTQVTLISLHEKKNVREHKFKCFIKNLTESGLEISREDLLNNKIKNIKHLYRNEVNKLKTPIKSGAGADDVYTRKKVDSFWRNVVSSKNSFQNHNNFQ